MNTLQVRETLKEYGICTVFFNTNQVKDHYDCDEKTAMHILEQAIYNRDLEILEQISLEIEYLADYYDLKPKEKKG